MALACELFGAKTKGYVLGIKGYTFNEFGEGLSAGALKNLATALMRRPVPMTRAVMVMLRLRLWRAVSCILASAL